MYNALRSLNPAYGPVTVHLGEISNLNTAINKTHQTDSSYSAIFFFLLPFVLLSLCHYSQKYPTQKLKEKTSHVLQPEIDFILFDSVIPLW